MTNTSKKIVSILGALVGVAIIIIGIFLQDTSKYAIGESIRFGADFYTEMYSVTKDVGRAINYAINDLICAVSWLIISLGAIDVCVFAYLFAKTEDASNYFNIKNIDKNVQALASPMIREAEEKAKQEAQEKAQREADEKAKRDADKKAKQEVEVKSEAAKKQAGTNAEEKASKPTLPPIKKEKTLSEKLEYALQYHTDDGMISYLTGIKDEAVQTILKQPAHLVREQVQGLLEHLQKEQ